MSFYENYVEDARGRSFILGLFLSALLILVNLWLALQNPELSGLGWLYLKEINSTDINWGLMTVFVLISWFTFLFLVIALANRREVNGDIASWGEIFIPAIFVLIVELALTNISIQGTTDVEAFKNFSGRMIWVTFLFNLLGIILVTIYFYFVNDKTE